MTVILRNIIVFDTVKKIDNNEKAKNPDGSV
jgi:hypothetical protein